MIFCIYKEVNAAVPLNHSPRIFQISQKCLKILNGASCDVFFDANSETPPTDMGLKRFPQYLYKKRIRLFRNQVGVL